MTDQPQRPPYPPAPPYPPHGNMPMPPRPAGGVPFPPVGMKMPPAGMKMPPRPMGYPMPPAGVKMPPRPVGVAPMGMPPPGRMPQPPVAIPDIETVPDIDLDKEWGDDPAEEQEPEEEKEEEQEQKEPEPEVDENGFIDDLQEFAEEPPKEEEPKENPYEHNWAADWGLPPFVIRTKFLMFTFLFFMLLGAGVMYGFSLMQNKKNNGMQGIVVNIEIPKGRPRCGLAQKGQGCVLYIMNAQQRELEGRDFFGTAAEILGIPRFQIETANIRYATTRIPPGYIALLNIPPIQ